MFEIHIGSSYVKSVLNIEGSFNEVIWQKNKYFFVIDIKTNEKTLNLVIDVFKAKEKKTNT